MADEYLNGDIVMNVNGENNKQYARLLTQSIRNVHVTVEVLDKNNKVISTIQGLSTGGSISVSNSSLIRRTGSLTMALFDFLKPKKESVLWMTNKIRVYVGLEDLSSSSNSITYFCQGTFYITEPSISISNDKREISISLEDNMMKWEQTELENKLKIEAGTPLHIAMYQVLNVNGEWNTDIQFSDLSVPYDLEFEIGTTVIDVIEKIRDLYMDWEAYYEIDGTFVFRKMKIQREDGEPISWRFDGVANLMTDVQHAFSYKEVRNRVVVIGNIDSKTGITPKAEVSIEEVASPFHKDEIGIRTKVVTEGSYSNQEQCTSKAIYELFKSSTFQEKITISTVPLYVLDANELIEVENETDGEFDRYIIEGISIDLAAGGDMSITGSKVYYNHFNIDDLTAKYRVGSELVSNGILNNGWLSLSEQRVKEYYGLEGDGSPLIVRFVYEALYGTTAYTTGFLDTKRQTLTIDLADFEKGTGESGDNNAGKAEYSDRILGHEMVHVIMNNAIGVVKTMQMPTWFKEGAAEFIHGADERLKSTIVSAGAINSELVNTLVIRATALLNGAQWESKSSDYSAGYLLVKYIDKKILSTKDMKDFMWALKMSPKTGDTALKEAIVELTGMTSYSEFVLDFSANAVAYVNSIGLDVGVDEIDTGSIGGIDHRGSLALNAEGVFDNSLAEKGIAARSMAVEIEKI